MSADLLREAAAKMRERAEAATPGDWSVVPGASNVWHFPDEGTPVLVAPGNGSEGHRIRQPDAEHIASWHPAVALAVADWLEADATVIERHDLDASISKALAVARAYMGREPLNANRARGAVDNARAFAAARRVSGNRIKKEAI